MSPPVVSLAALLAGIFLAPADAGPGEHRSTAAGAGVGLARFRLPVLEVLPALAAMLQLTAALCPLADEGVKEKGGRPGSAR